MDNKTTPLPPNEAEQAFQISSIIKNGVLYKNPVLYSALGLCPVIAAGQTLQDGLALSVLLACILIPCSLIASIVGTRLSAAVRPPLYLLLSGGLYFLGSAVVNALFPGILLNLGVFAPLMVINAIIIRRADTFAAKHIVFAAVVDAIACSIGFALVMCVAAGLREMLTMGTVAGLHVYPRRWKIPGAALTCTGFIFLGFMSAFVHALRNRRDRRLQKKGRVNQ